MTEVDVSEAAKRSEMSTYHLRRLLKDGKIAGRQVPIPGGHYWMVNVDDLERYMNDWRARKPGARKKASNGH